MATRITINGLQTYRISEFTQETTETFFGRLLNTPAIEARLTKENIDKVREVPIELNNSGGWINLASEPLWGNDVTIEQDGIAEVWAGRITSFTENNTQVLSISVTEDPQAIFSLYVPNKILRVGSFADLDASYNNSVIPIPFGGTTADPIRMKGMLANRVTFDYIFAEGELQWSGRVFQDNVQVTSGFTVFLGSASQTDYPGFAFVRFNADPRDSAGRWPEVVVEVTGVKLGTSTEAECRNPMRILQYLLTTARGGVGGWGLGVAAAKLDTAAFAQAISDCNSGGVNFYVDGIMLTRSEARVLRDELLKSCRGSLGFVAGKYYPKVDKIAASVKSFDEANFIPNAFGKGSLTKRYNLITAEYRYRYGSSSFDFLGWQERTDPVSIAAIKENALKLTFQLVSDHNAAGALLDYEIYKAAYTEKVIRFQTPDFSGLQNGSVITVTYARWGLAAAKFRIFNFVPGTTGSRPLAFVEAESYSDAIFTVDAIGAMPDDPVVSTKLNGSSVDIVPDSISGLSLSTGSAKRKDGTIFAWIDGTFTKGRNFLTAEVLVSEDLGITYKSIANTPSNAFRYGPANPGSLYFVRVIATGTSGQAAPVSTSITTGGATAPADVTGFTAVQDSLDFRKVNFTYNPVNDSDLRFYEIRKGMVWETAEIIGQQIVGTKFETFENANGTHTYLVKGVDTSGNYSANAASKSVALVIFPSDVANFVASQNGENVLLSWAMPPDLDLLGFEIREGASWDLGQIVFDTITDIAALLPVAFERSYTYWIKAKSRRRAYSQNAASATVVVSNLLPKNYVITKNEIADPTGSHFQTQIGSPFWTFDNMPGGFDEYPNLNFNDFPGSSVLKLATTTTTVPGTTDHNEIALPTGLFSNTEITPTRFTFDRMQQEFDKYPTLQFSDIPSGDTLKLTNVGGVYPLAGSYLVEYDLGSLLTVQIDVDWAFLAIPTGSSAVLEMRLSNDGVIWSAWDVFTSSQKACRYVQLRLSITSTSVIETPEVSRFIVTFSPATGDPLYFDSGYYIVQYDIGQPTTCAIAVDKFLFILPPEVSATLDYRYSVDGVDWSAWDVFVPSMKTFRYIEFRMNLATSDNTVTPEITRFSVAIDVPDIDQKGHEVVDIAGQTVTYPAEYVFPPALVVTAEGTDVYAEYDLVTKTDFFVQVKRISDGTAIGGKTINWISKGY